MSDNLSTTFLQLLLGNRVFLMGFTDHSDLKTLLLLVFSAIHLITMVRNLSLVVLIYMDHHCHTPMYILLGNLVLKDSCCSCAITPKIKENFFFCGQKYFFL